MGVDLLGYLCGFLYVLVEVLIIVFFAVKITYKNLHIKEMEELLTKIEENINKK